MLRKCLWCSKPISSYRRDSAQFCNKTCAAKYRNRRDGKTSPIREVVCEECGKSFKTSIKRQKFCASVCYNKNYESRYGYRKLNGANPLNLAPSTVGAVSELLVCADLLAKGYAVFRALSPACVCDLAILSGQTLLRVEVTTAYLLKSGKRMAPKKDPSNYDVLAHVISATGEIVYEPSLPARFTGADKSQEICN